jgi:hypothetical protein
MQNPRAQSFKPLTISAERLPSSTVHQETVTRYAAARAKILLGCYRTGEANDPETYVAAVTAVLSHFPEEVITSVTHPVTGLPKKSSWLPTIKEVNDACNEAIEPIRQHEARLKRIKEQLEMREREDRGEKPTMEHLKAKYGPNWGIGRHNPIAERSANEAENKAEMVRQRARVHAEYTAVGLLPPSLFALSMTARREMAKRDEFNAVASPVNSLASEGS